MKLLRLKLENFRQHRESDIQFTDGMTAIVGVNGTGKTTILEAITFALYGVQRKTKESIRFYWAEQRSKVRVELEFEFERCRYRLERSTTDACLTDLTADPPVTKATGLREVKAACERLLRLTYDQFKNSFCAEQKSLTFLQFNTDTRRQEQVAKMLGFDRLKGAADLARERGKVYRGIAEQLAATMGNLEQLAADRKQAHEDLSSRIRLLKESELAHVHVGKLLPAAEERKKLADEFFRLTQEASVFGSNAEALKASRKRAEEAAEKAKADVTRRAGLLPSHDECVRLEQAVLEMLALREIQIDREKMQAELGRIEVEVKDLDGRLLQLKGADVETARKLAQRRGAEHTNAMNAVREAEMAWSKSRQSAQATLSTAEAEGKATRQAFEKAKELVEKGICPECGQATTSSFAERLALLGKEADRTTAAETAAREKLTQVEARPKAVFDAEDSLEAARKATLEAQEALTIAEKAESEAKGLRDERQSKERRIGVLSAELAKTVAHYNREAHQVADARLKELRPLREECLKLAGAEEALKHAAAAFGEAKKEIDEAQANFQRLRAERAKLPFESSEQASEAIADFEALRRKESDAAMQVRQAESNVKLAESNLLRADDRVATYAQAEASLKLGRSQALLHETADKELKILREELNSVIRPDLEARASENLSLLTNGRYPILELDEEFNATVIDDGVQKQVISGGEEDVVALALRMALSELIQERQGRPMSLMILDEVFGSLDVDRRQAVLERLHSIKGRFAQILVISHIEEINQVADQCIFLTRDDKTRSTVIGDLPLETGQLVLSS